MILRLKSKAKKLSTAALVVGAMEVVAPLRGMAVELPQASSVWVTSGAATRAQNANTLTVNQGTNKAIFNWDSFNISADGHVIFNQPNSSSVALNRIQQADPSRIFGELKANGQLYLINQNGFLFGSTARVNTGGLVASSLNITDDIFKNGFLSANNTAPPTAALAGTPGSIAKIEVQPGARLTTNGANQRILLAANRIENAGQITANDGQVILAAGDSVYVNASSDPQLRGLLVEVNGGTADSAVLNTGTVTAERGNITAVGLAINQSGRMTATTSVNVNGSIRLLARNNVTVTTESGSNVWKANSGGTLTLGQGSVTEVNPDTVDTSAAVDEQKQALSSIEMSGKTVTFNSGSAVRAAGGTLSVVAATNLAASRADSTTLDTDASITVDNGALIDLSGSIANTSVTRNLVIVELRANELADSPLQRDGVLRGKTVTVDARVGTSLADVSGAISLIKKDVLERTSEGGSVVFDTAGRIAVNDNATIDVSGGAVNFAGGIMQTTKLIKADGTVVDIDSASKDSLYAGLLSPVYKSASDRWGVTKYIQGPSIGKFEDGYTDGADAGSIQFMGNSLALNGHFLGQATAGQRQRSADNLPKGGQFIVGATRDSEGKVPAFWRAPDLTLTRKVFTANTAVVNALPGKPAALAPTTTELSTDFIDHGGFTRVQLSSDKGITIAAGTPIDPGVGGSLLLNAPLININSDITTHGGSIAADSTAATNAPVLADAGIKVANGVTLNVSGLWTNDANLPPNQTPLDVVVLKAGSISLKQTAPSGTLEIGNDVSLLADGGAWMKQSGAIASGAGGKISIIQNGDALGVNSTQMLKIGSHLQLSGVGVQGAAGGTFLLRAPRLSIDDSTEALGSQQAVGTYTGGDAVHLGSRLFSDYGFANFVLQADRLPPAGDDSSASISIAPGTHLDLQPKTRWLNASALRENSGSAIAALSDYVGLPEYLSKPSSLTLTSSALGNNRDLSAFAGINVAQGAVITATPGSSINLTANGDVRFSGAIHAAGGSVLMKVNQGDDGSSGFIDRQVLIADQATIDVAGKGILVPNALGLRQGTVRDGGTVALTNDRGSINLMQGSVIDVSGSQAMLDVLPQGSAGYQQIAVASKGGSLAVTAKESINLQGELHAHGGVANGIEADGGSLSITLDRSKTVQVDSGKTPFPANDRVIQLVQHSSSLPVNGVASVGADFIANSGVGSLALKATHEIDVAAGVNLSLQRDVTLDAPAIGVMGQGEAKLSAATLTMGGSSVANNYVPTLAAGKGVLTLQADYVNLRNILGFTKVAQANIISTGDIALTNAIAVDGLSGNAKNLLTAGDLLFKSRRVLPTTRSVYTMDATTTLRDANNQLVAARNIAFEQQGTSPGVPLSAAGQLSVAANNITQGGSLYAPFGKITLNALNDLKLLNGSVTSVSADGTVVPYGRVDNGTSWVWGTSGAAASEVGSVPTGAVSLTGNSVQMNAGSVVNVSGGGDLSAYQFTPGTGGKQDVLNPASAGYLKNAYAIIPANAAGSMPYDPMMWEGSGLTPGQSVYLSAGSGVPAGVYQLLPARYALTNGAYLISANSSYQDLPAGKTATLVDGATVVSGYYTFGSQQNAAARTSGFVVRPGSYVRTLAQYDNYLASDFFAAKASKAGITALLTNDAGALTVAVNNSLAAAGEVLAAGKTRAGKQGRNANVDITTTGNSLEIDSGTVTTGTVGVVHVSSNTLSTWRAGSLLLGGSRDASGAVNVRTTDVTVHDGVNLSADEVMLAAARNLTVESGARIGSSSGTNANVTINEDALSQATTLNLTGTTAAKAAVLAVSDQRYLVANRGVARNGANAGALTVQSGAQVASRGALLVDAAGDVTLANNSIQATGASWALGASDINVGGNSESKKLTINDSLQQGLQSARAITLASEHDLKLNKAVALGNANTRTMSLQADRIINAAGTATSIFNANTLNISGITDTSKINAISAGTGSLVFNADEIRLGKNQLGISGFGKTTLNSRGLVIATATGGIQTKGDMDIVSTALTVKSGAIANITADNRLLHLTNAAGSAPEAHSLNSGGELSLTAQSIVDEARILMPSGVVTLGAGNSLQLNNAAVIDTSGYQPLLASSGSNGGRINLKSGGDLAVASGVQLDVSAGPKADAGRINVDAAGNAVLNGQYRGAAGGDAQSGGQFVLTANSLNDFAALNQSLEQGGFTEQRSVRVSTGDLALAQGQKITARQIELDADSGTVSINGQLIARSTERRSHIEVNAGNNVVVGSSAVIDADADNADLHKAGDILLNSSNGKLQLASTATVRAHGKDGSGSLTLRAAATGNNFNNLESVPTDLSHVDAVVLEPVKRGGIYALSGGVLDATQLDAMHDDLGNYVAAAAAGTRTRLGLGSNVAFRPYADITHAGDLSVDSYDFNAANWHFDGNNAATVSIRSTGKLQLTGILSDGFEDQGAGLDLSAETHSVGFNLVAGADLNAAGNHATQRGSGADMVLDDYAIVRTGTGDINLTAARDVTVGTSASVYTGGQRGAESWIDDGGFIAAFGRDGGAVNVVAGRDVMGNLGSQYATQDWQVHWAEYEKDDRGQNTEKLIPQAFWGVNFGLFDWNIGALGGGDVHVAAGRDVSNLSLALADSMADNSGIRQRTGNVRTAFGGGNLAVNAGRDVNSISPYIANGRADIQATGAMAGSGTYLLAGTAGYNLAATRDVLFNGIGQQSLITQSQFSGGHTYSRDASIQRLASLNIQPVSTEIWYSRFGESSTLTISSAGGDVKLSDQVALLPLFVKGNDTEYASMAPGSVTVAAWGGNIDLSALPQMTPSRSGTLNLYARQDIVAASGGVRMSDVDLATTGLSPDRVTTDSAFSFINTVLSNKSAVLHRDDSVASSVVAGRDLKNAALYLAEAVHVEAGRDITQLILDTQQSGTATTTQIIAGRDFVYGLTKEDGFVSVAGSGLLGIQAGRDVNFGVTHGVTSSGRLLNGNLPEKPGANVVVMAGLSQPLNITAFMSDIVDKSESLKTDLVKFVESVTQQSGLDYTLASSAFRNMSEIEQRQFSLAALFTELVASGAEANSGKGYDRGFAAIKSLFPKSQDKDSPYKGDISLPFSRVYTLDGGTITMLAPGGKIDVGLSNAPSNLTGSAKGSVESRKASELGIVAQGTGDIRVMSQGDVLVNSSRIFTLGGGDIDIWSSAGNIDAGKGAKSSLSAPPPTVSVDAQGNVVVSFGAAIAGSGIRTIQVSDDIKPGDVNLLAPAGFVNAGDAGIGSAGNLTIAAQRVVGLDNIQVGGASSGVPAETSGLGASLSGASAVGSGAANSAGNAAATQSADNQAKSPLAETVLSWLEVFVVGLGEDNCKQDDLECLKRQSIK